MPWCKLHYILLYSSPAIRTEGAYHAITIRMGNLFTSVLRISISSSHLHLQNLSPYLQTYEEGHDRGNGDPLVIKMEEWIMGGGVPKGVMVILIPR